MTSSTATQAPPALALWQALVGAHTALVARLDPETPDCAVVGSDTIEVLLPLSTAPDRRMRMHELADRSHVTRSGLTRRVDRLVADGWVEREYCDADRRGAYARLTETGAAELARALPHHVGALERHLSDRLSRTEMATLTELLSRL
ncbi:MAG: MarR family transcriptional regulator [Chloroflexi bacterium]|nr:MarR family transcriptional regulator [Chloroflexota bacterium]